MFEMNENMLSNPFPNAFGLDITDLSIKVVQLRNVSLRHRKPSYEVDALRSVELPYGLIVDGEIEQPEPVRKYLLHLLSEQKGKKIPAISGPWVVASLPEKKNFLKLITIPKSSEDVIDEDIILTAKQHIPFENDSYYMDWQVVPSGHADETTVLLAVTEKKVADMYTYLIESVGLGVMALENESLAIARTMITAEKMYENEARALLDIGASKTTLTVYDHNSIRFSTVLPYSGEIVTTLLIQKLKLSKEDAEKIKKEIGLRYSQKQGETKVWNTLMQSTDELARHIEKAIKFYYSHFPNANKVTHITMSGGGSLMPKLDKILSTKLKIVSRPGRPWKNLAVTQHGFSEDEGVRYACAIGLALRAADNPFVSFDTV